MVSCKDDCGCGRVMYEAKSEKALVGEDIEVDGDGDQMKKKKKKKNKSERGVVGGKEGFESTLGNVNAEIG